MPYRIAQRPITDLKYQPEGGRAPPSRGFHLLSTLQIQAKLQTGHSMHLQNLKNPSALGGQQEKDKVGNLSQNQSQKGGAKLDNCYRQQSDAPSSL